MLRKSNFIFSDGLSRSLTIQLLTNIYDRDGKKTARFRLPQPYHGRLQAQARRRVRDLHSCY